MASYDWPPSGGGSGGGSGTVTSVALSLPGSVFNITGSPVTTFGTLMGTFAIQAANYVFAGPTSGSPDTPSFRALVAADIPSLSATYVTQSEIGAANGVAALDSSGHIPVAQLTNSVIVYQGLWASVTNTPMLADGTGTTGQVYWCSDTSQGPVAGLNNTSMYNFQIGDLVLYNGSEWELTTPAAGVQSVNTMTGQVTVNAINQLTGDITTTAAIDSQSKVASLVATTNSTLTTLNSLILPLSQTSGTLGIAQGGTGQTSKAAAYNALTPLAATGDTIYEASPGVATVLPIGTNGYVLTVAAGVPTWALSPGGVSSVNGATGATTVNAINALTGDITAGPATQSQSEAATVAKIQGTTVSGTTGSGNVVFSASPTLSGTGLFTNLTGTGTLIVPAIDSTAGAGTALSIQGGSAASPGNGGSVTIAGASGSSTTTGGTGGTLNLNGGNGNGTGNNAGGAVNIQAGTSVFGSAGGTVTISSGTGGVGAATTGQTGGTTNVNGGTGGVGSSTSGNGGGATVKAGSGGGGVGGGTGGTAQLVGGTGGTGSSTGGNGGAANITGGSPGSVAGAAGGAVSITSANGTSTGSGGAGGSVTISSGQANGDNTANNAGGSVTLSVGVSKGSAGGSNLTMTAGTGGIGTSTAGANGGNTVINAGVGGAGSSTGGTGGTITINAGAGGNSTTPGTGGDIEFFVGATTSVTEHFRISHLGTVFATNAQIQAATAGFGFSVKSGSNCKMGTATLVGGTVTVSNTSVTSNSLIFLTTQSVGGTVGYSYISAKVASTSFTITSISALDTSIVAWLIMEEM